MPGTISAASIIFFMFSMILNLDQYVKYFLSEWFLMSTDIRSVDIKSILSYPVGHHIDWINWRDCHLTWSV